MTKILTVVGLGSGSKDQLTLGILDTLKSSRRLFLRTEQHPVVAYLRELGVDYVSFDEEYERHSTFDKVYESIVEQMIEAASQEQGEVVYAVPGHPMVAEYTVVLLKERCSSHNIELRLMGGESFLDQAFSRLGFDPIEGFQLVDGSQVDTVQFSPGQHLIFAQVYDQYKASEVKLSLMAWYPDEFEIVVAHTLGIEGREVIRQVPLYELDRVEGYGNMSIIWVPRTDVDAVSNRTFKRLHEIVDILRSPEGCPWDREQTHRSIRKNLIEETYEVLETIDDDDPVAMCEELGDLLLQVMLHSQMEEETGAFTVFDVIEGINEKLIRRHPHVFGTLEAGNAEEALQNWDAIKREEKLRSGQDPDRKSVLDGIPRDLPAMMKAVKLQKKASKVGFDWNRLEEVFSKVEEEINELKEAAGRQDEQHTLEELGDLLFAVVNAARFCDLDPEEALTYTNRKFTQRFEYIEDQLRAQGKSFKQTNLSEMESWWQESKQIKVEK